MDIEMLHSGHLEIILRMSRFDKNTINRGMFHPLGVSTKDMRTLVAAGLFTAGVTRDGAPVFHLTDEGKQLVPEVVAAFRDIMARREVVA